MRKRREMILQQHHATNATCLLIIRIRDDTVHAAPRDKADFRENSSEKCEITTNCARPEQSIRYLFLT